MQPAMPHGTAQAGLGLGLHYSTWLDPIVVVAGCLPASRASLHPRRRGLPTRPVAKQGVDRHCVRGVPLISPTSVFQHDLSSSAPSAPTTAQPTHLQLQCSPASSFRAPSWGCNQPWLGWSTAQHAVHDRTGLGWWTAHAAAVWLPVVAPQPSPHPRPGPAL
jgi:hypothetical protein